MLLERGRRDLRDGAWGEGGETGRQRPRHRRLAHGLPVEHRHPGFPPLVVHRPESSPALVPSLAGRPAARARGRRACARRAWAARCDEGAARYRAPAGVSATPIVAPSRCRMMRGVRKTTTDGEQGPRPSSQAAPDARQAVDRPSQKARVSATAGTPRSTRRSGPRRSGVPAMRPAASRASWSDSARIAAASSAAFSALPIATVATGMPRGIWTIESSESRPPRCCVGIGTPMTGSVVLAASMPGRCAAPPAPAMITRSPRPAAVSA